MGVDLIDKIATPLSMFGMAAACSLIARYEEGAAWARRVLVLQPTDLRGLFTLTSNLYLAGRLAEAEATVALIKQYHPHLKSPHLRQSFRVRQPADMSIVERVVTFIGLPE